MPEGVEIEMYRRHGERLVGETVAEIHAPDEWFLKDTSEPELVDALIGATVEAARRRGKLLVLDVSTGHRLGLRFGMTGRLVVDEVSSIEYLEYSSHRNDPAWDRFGIRFRSGVQAVVRDPRRLGGVLLDPDEDELGPDVFSISLGQLRDRVLVGKVALKGRLLDQARVAGIGNLIADEVLWRSGLDPARRADSLDEAEAKRLHQTIRSVVAEFLDSGGSHTGKLHPARIRGGHCPQDGEALDRRTIGGRTTFSCPVHQI